MEEREAFDVLWGIARQHGLDQVMIERGYITPEERDVRRIAVYDILLRFMSPRYNFMREIIESLRMLEDLPSLSQFDPRIISLDTGSKSVYAEGETYDCSNIYSFLLSFEQEDLSLVFMNKETPVFPYVEGGLGPDIIHLIGGICNSTMRFDIDDDRIQPFTIDMITTNGQAGYFLLKTSSGIAILIEQKLHKPSEPDSLTLALSIILSPEDADVAAKIAESYKTGEA